MIAVTFACGHASKLDDTAALAVCPECGERRVRAVKARAPKFRGVCLGPHAKFESLAGIPVTVGASDAE